MRNYDAMTRANLIELIESLESAKAFAPADPSASATANPSNTNGQRAAIPDLVNLETALSETVSDLKRIQEWLGRSQSYANFGIWDWDLKTGITHLSEQVATLFGQDHPSLETTRDVFLNAVHTDDRQHVIEAIHACSNCERNCGECSDDFDVQYRIVKPDGAVRWMHERGGVERLENGSPCRILGVVQDITEQKQSEQALRESEQYFRLFAENVREMIWIATPDFSRLIYVSPACSEIFGITRDDFYQTVRRWRSLIYQEDFPLIEAARVKQEQGLAMEVEVRIIRPDGKIRWIRIRSFPVKSGNGERMASGITEDVTDRRQLEEERLAHMMQQRTNLVREVHHRIKNNLQGVAGLLRQQANEHPEVSAIIDQAIAQVRTVAVVHGLQGQASDNEVVLCEMVPSIAHTVQTVLSPYARLDVRVDVPQRIRVSEQETVPIALILNELIMNAAKHASGTTDTPHISIAVTWDQDHARAVISIVNPGELPGGFDFVSANGTGTGLELVRSLLPPRGEVISLVSSGGQVRAELMLVAPSIYNI